MTHIVVRSTPAHLGPAAPNQRGWRSLIVPFLLVLGFAEVAHAQAPTGDGPDVPAGAEAQAPDPASPPAALSAPPTGDAPAPEPASPPAVAAQPDGDPANIPLELPGFEIVITASHHDEPAFQSPRAVSIVGRQDMDERASRSTPEALLEETGVFVQRTNHGGGSPIIRGQFGNRILLLVDGIRLNNSTFRQGTNQYLNTVDPLVVDRIEVVRGPGSALYGSDAIGGLVNVLTERPRLGGGGAYGSARLASASMDQSAQLGLRLGWAGERTGAFASVSVRHFGDLRASGGYLQRFTGYDEWGATGSGLVELRPGHQLTLSVQAHSQRDVPRSDRSFPLDFRVFSVQNRQLAYARYTADKLGPFDQATATLSYGRQRELQTRYQVDRDARVADELIAGTLGVLASGELEAAGPLVVGAELYMDQLDLAATSGTLTGAVAADPSALRYPKGISHLSTAAFAHHELGLSGSWKLVSEARLGLIRIRVPDDNRLVLLFPDDNLPVLPAVRDLVPVYAGGLHARWEAAPWAAVSAGAMLGFRSPNVDDYARSGVEGPAYQIPARSLDPERALSGEIGVKLVPGRVDVSATYAYTIIDDAIARQVSSLGGGTITMIDGQRILESGNTDSARYHSVELAGTAPVWRRLSAFGTFAWTRGEQIVSDPVAMTTVREPASKTPPPFGTLGLRWSAPGGRWFGEGLLRYAFDQSRLSDLDRNDPRICPEVPGTCRGTPGWAVLAARAGARISSHLRVTVAVENLTDASYRYHASGIQSAGLGVTGLVEGEL